jgi:predicted RNA-binding protein with RPS1 domain
MVVVKVIDIDERGRVNLTLKGVTDEEREDTLAKLAAAG